MSSGAHGDGSIQGRLGTADGLGMVHIEALCDAGVADVWGALTDRCRLGHWLGDLVGNLRQGGEFASLFTASGWEGTGRVEICEPPRRLLVRMNSADDPGSCFEVTLTPDGEQTVLVVEDRGLPLDQMAAYGAGDQIHVEDLLGGRPRCEPRTRWAELHPGYQELAAALVPGGGLPA